MPSRKPARKVALTVKLPADFCAEVRSFAAREIGRPIYVRSLSALVEQALRREIERLNLVLAGALPLDRATGRDAPGDREPPGGGGGHAEPARRPVNANKR